MSSEQDNTALVAIIIAVIAFFVATGQLLQQIFGTAVGYRHCQASVIGGWATLTKRKWRWSEFRFETRFTAPNIRLVHVTDPNVSMKEELVTGDGNSRQRTYIPPETRTQNEESDLVGWLTLLDLLHDLQSKCLSNRIKGLADIAPNVVARRKSTSPFCGMTCPAITFRERSWDLMPPDIIRPVATSTVGDVIVLAHRLGLGWNDLRPGDNVMRAEGGGKSIVATTVRGFGLLLQFTYDPAGTDTVPESCADCLVPSASADMLGFGIIKHSYGNPDLYRLESHDLVFDGVDEIEAVKGVMRQLYINRSAISRFGQYMELSDNFLGFSDILGMWAPFMPLEGSRSTKIMRVHRDVERSLLRSSEFFVAFESRLTAFQNEERCSERMTYLLKTYRSLKDKWKGVWEWNVELELRSIRLTTGFLSDIRGLWEETSEYLRLAQYKGIRRFRTLVAAHITQAIDYLAETASKEKIERDIHNEGSISDTGSQIVNEMYFDRISFVLKFMSERRYKDSREVEDAWWTLIFRAMLWHRGHDFEEGKTRGYGGIPVSSAFWGSKLPVYIA